MKIKKINEYFDISNGNTSDIQNNFNKIYNTIKKYIDITLKSDINLF